MPEISIIVPVYQALNTLDTCVKSILSQTYSDFELLLIDDGSTDGSDKLCDLYQSIDSRVIAIHQKNKGVSAARNHGINLSSGKYIMFCDSDDYVDAQWCELLYHSILQYPQHFITCNCHRVSINNEIKPYSSPDNCKKIFYSYYELWKLGLSNYSVTKIYDKSKIDKYHIRFKENISFAEDVAFNVDYFQTCCNAIILPDRLYYYRDNPSSLMHRRYDDFFPVFSYPFSVRLPLIREQELGDYCDFWLYEFMKMFDYIFLRHNMSTFKQLQYNQKILSSKEFQYCLRYAAGRRESAITLAILKTKNYYLFWLFNQLREIKKKLIG